MLFKGFNKEEKCNIYIYIFLLLSIIFNEYKIYFSFALFHSINIQKFRHARNYHYQRRTTGENHPQKSSRRGFDHTLRPIILELIERTKYICTHVKYTTFKHSRDTLDGRKIWRRSFFFFFYTFVYVGELARPWTQKRPPRFLKTYVYKLCMKQRP